MSSHNIFGSSLYIMSVLSGELANTWLIIFSLTYLCNIPILPLNFTDFPYLLGVVNKCKNISCLAAKTHIIIRHQYSTNCILLNNAIVTPR